MRYRDRERRLAALEAAQEAQNRRAALADASRRPLAYRCYTCRHDASASDWHTEGGERPDPARTDRVCPTCGEIALVCVGPRAHATPHVSRHRCVVCDDEHDAATRPASHWSPAGACPNCGATPPPPPDDNDERFCGWLREAAPIAAVLIWARGLLDDNDERFCGWLREAAPIAAVLIWARELLKDGAAAIDRDGPFVVQTHPTEQRDRIAAIIERAYAYARTHNLVLTPIDHTELLAHIGRVDAGEIRYIAPSGRPKPRHWFAPADGRLGRRRGAARCPPDRPVP